MHWEPRKYQQDAVSFGLRTPVCAYILDMGLGKTVCTLSVLAEEIDLCLTYGTCIVAPINVVREVWVQEAEKWDHLRHLKIVRVEGTEAERIATLVAGGADIYLVSYSNLLWLADWMLNNQPPFEDMIFDESSMMKSPAAKRFKRMKPFMPFFRRKMILTGTPAAESLINLWAQYYLLDQGKRLGKYITHFKHEHYTQRDRMGYKLDLRAGHDKIIYKAVKDITLTLRAEDHLDMKAPIVNVIKVDLGEKLCKEYKKFESEMFMQMEDETEVEALNAAALSMKCRQFTSGAIYVADEEKRNHTKHLHDKKIEALTAMIEQMDGQPLLVAYEFRHEAERFAKLWPKAPIIGGGVKKAEMNRAFAAWNKGKIPVMFVQPQSVGHGINLQYGGHHLLWYTTTWSGERHQQMNARLHRQGQTKQVVLHYLVCPKTIDTLVMSAQNRKSTSQNNLMNALKAYKEKSLRS